MDEFRQQMKAEWEQSELYAEVLQLYGELADTDDNIYMGFNTASKKNLKLKKKVLEEIKAGKSQTEIGDDYAKILEYGVRYPEI